MPRNNGKKLEDEIHHRIPSMFDKGEIPYRKELTRLRRTARYYSQIRKAQVEFENVLEVYTKNSIDTHDAQPTHVVFFECKDHRRKIEVGEVDEVVGRLNLHFGFNMKAYIVTRGGFSRSAIATAQNNGIGLIKFMPEDKIHFIMYMITQAEIEHNRHELPRRAMRSLIDPDYTSGGEDFFAMDGGRAFDDFRAMFANHFRGLKVSPT